MNVRTQYGSQQHIGKDNCHNQRSENSPKRFGLYFSLPAEKDSIAGRKLQLVGLRPNLVRNFIECAFGDVGFDRDESLLVFTGNAGFTFPLNDFSQCRNRCHTFSRLDENLLCIFGNISISFGQTNPNIVFLPALFVQRSNFACQTRSQCTTELRHCDSVLLELISIWNYCEFGLASFDACLRIRCAGNPINNRLHFLGNGG